MESLDCNWMEKSMNAPTTNTGKNVKTCINFHRNLAYRSSSLGLIICSASSAVIMTAYLADI